MLLQQKGCRLQLRAVCHGQIGCQFQPLWSVCFVNRFENFLRPTCQQSAKETNAVRCDGGFGRSPTRLVLEIDSNAPQTERPVSHRRAGIAVRSARAVATANKVRLPRWNGISATCIEPARSLTPAGEVPCQRTCVSLQLYTCTPPDHSCRCLIRLLLCIISLLTPNDSPLPLVCRPGKWVQRTPGRATKHPIRQIMMPKQEKRPMFRARMRRQSNTSAKRSKSNPRPKKRGRRRGFTVDASTCGTCLG